MKYIDNLLNKYTMYKVVLYGLSILSVLAIIFGFSGIIDFSGTSLLVSFVLIMFTTYVINKLFSIVFSAPSNPESTVITALILFLILIPADNSLDYWYLALASFIAIASKYLIAVRKRHIFNPVAISLLVMDLIGAGVSLWWINSPVTIVAILVVGLLIVRKIKRFNIFLSFLITGLAVTFISALVQGQSDLFAFIYSHLVSGPAIFFGTIMVTEPLTTPERKSQQTIYGILVGVIASLGVHVWGISTTPEFALVLANIYSFAVSTKRKFILTLKEKMEISPNVFDFKFASDAPVNFSAGQYMEWTLDHDKADLRGIRRYFTIASRPNTSEVHLGIRVSPQNGSSFKNALVNMSEGDTMTAGNIYGEFILPKDFSRKLVFIAGGIGITPFVSMLEDLAVKGERRDIVLLYCAGTENDFSYREDFDAIALRVGLKSVYIPTIKNGPITEDLIKKEIPDYVARDYYISGPHGMVENYKGLLKKIGVGKGQVHTDYFPGF